MISSSNFSSHRFILQSKDYINNQLLEKQKTAEDKIKELEVNYVSFSVASHTHTDRKAYPVYILVI